MHGKTVVKETFKFVLKRVEANVMPRQDVHRNALEAFLPVGSVTPYMNLVALQGLSASP